MAAKTGTKEQKKDKWKTDAPDQGCSENYTNGIQLVRSH
jgi:hypothetical protein